MKKAFVFTVLSFLIVVQLFSACARNTADSPNSSAGQQADNRNKVENPEKIGDTAEDLKTLINIPFEPEETVWRENKAQGSAGGAASNDRKNLTAIFRFSAEDADKLAAKAETHKTPTPTLVQTEEWFPAELIAQSELSGDETLKGTGFAADDFVQPPYTQGQIVRIENSNYFILELSAK